MSAPLSVCGFIFLRFTSNAGKIPRPLKSYTNCLPPIYPDAEKWRRVNIPFNYTVSISNVLTNFRCEFPTPKQGRHFISIYFRKHSLFETQPPSSFQLSNFSFYLWGHLKPQVYSAPIKNEETLHQLNFYECQTIRSRSGSFESVRKSVSRRVYACIDFGGTFEYLL